MAVLELNKANKWVEILNKIEVKDKKRYSLRPILRERINFSQNSNYKSERLDQI
jgi:hypothetical protein